MNGGYNTSRETKKVEVEDVDFLGVNHDFVCLFIYVLLLFFSRT